MRLLTLTGPGGTGKTRLAIEVAAGPADAFPDGVAFVPLAAIRDPDLVPSAIAQTLGVLEGSARSVLDGLREVLRERATLLVLDNFEQVLEAAPALADLLAACPRLAILVTSRAVLRLSGEHDYAVPPVALPAPGQRRSASALLDASAARLFVERARAATTAFEVTDENAAVVADICARVDGIPLTLELAAARVRLLPPVALLARLERRLLLLTGGARDLPERQRTLRDTIAWSYDPLAPEEQRLFRCLGAFASGWILEAAEAVCNLEGDLDVLGGLGALVDESLVRQDQAWDEARFGRLETIREYALERLAEGGDEANQVRHRHLAHFLALAEMAAEQMAGPRQPAWFARLERELDNVRAALAWAEEQEDIKALLRLVCALNIFWMGRGRLAESRRWLEAGLGRADAVPPLLRVKAVFALGELSWATGDYERAVAYLTQSRELSRELGVTWVEAWSLHYLAFIAGWQGQHTRSRALFGESIALCRRIGDAHCTVWALIDQGDTLRHEGAHAEARASLEEGLALTVEVGDPWQTAVACALLGYLALAEGDVEQAAVRATEALAMMRDRATR